MQGGCGKHCTTDEDLYLRTRDDDAEDSHETLSSSHSRLRSRTLEQNFGSRKNCHPTVSLQSLLIIYNFATNKTSFLALYTTQRSVMLSSSIHRLN